MSKSSHVLRLRDRGVMIVQVLLGNIRVLNPDRREVPLGSRVDRPTTVGEIATQSNVWTTMASLYFTNREGYILVVQ